MGLYVDKGWLRMFSNEGSSRLVQYVDIGLDGWSKNNDGGPVIYKYTNSSTKIKINKDPRVIITLVNDPKRIVHVSSGYQKRRGSESVVLVGKF